MKEETTWMQEGCGCIIGLAVLLLCLLLVVKVLKFMWML